MVLCVSFNIPKNPKKSILCIPILGEKGIYKEVFQIFKATKLVR